MPKLFLGNPANPSNDRSNIIWQLTNSTNRF